MFINKYIDLSSLQDMCIQHLLEEVQIDAIDSAKEQIIVVLYACKMSSSKQIAIRIHWSVL